MQMTKGSKLVFLDISHWYTVLQLTNNSTSNYVGHQMITTMQCNVLLVVATGKKKLRERQRDEQDSRQPTLILFHWRESLEFYYQTSTAAELQGGKHAVHFLSASISPHTPSSLLSLSSFFSSHIQYVTSNTLFHPYLASPLTECLICSLMLSGMQQPFLGSLLEVELVSHCLTEGKEGQMESKERNGALSCSIGGETRDRENAEAEQGGWAGMGGLWGFTEEELQYWGFYPEKRDSQSVNTQHYHSGFPTLLQPSIRLKFGTWQQLTASTAGGNTEDHTAHAVYAGLLHMYCMCTSMHEIGFIAADGTRAICKRDV